MKKNILLVLGTLLVAFVVFGLSMYFISGRFLSFRKPSPIQKIVVPKTTSPSGSVTKADFPSGRIGFYVMGTFLSPISAVSSEATTTFVIDGDPSATNITIYITMTDGQFSIERHLKDFSDSPQVFDVNFPILETIVSSGRKAKLRMIYDPGTSNPEEILAIETFTAALNGTLNIPANLILRPIGMEIVGE